jgi:ketosteroid isomerase-like protein
MDHAGVIHAYFKLVDERQFDQFGTIFHDEIIYDRPGYQPLIGLKAVIRFYQRKRRIKSGGHTIEGLIINGDQAACWGRFEGKTRRDKLIDERFADIYQFRDGKIFRRTTYFYRRAI